MFVFTKAELRDLTISFIVLTICFSIATSGFNPHAFVSALPIVIVGVAIGSLAHELGHKYVAMEHGCDAEFKLWPLGLVIAFITSFFGVVFASPGSTQVSSGHVSDEVNGRISIAGPGANMMLAVIFIAIAILMYPLKFHWVVFDLIFLISTIGFSVNCFLATFNLLPIYSLDGTKVLKWNAGVWFTTIMISGIMMLISIAIGPENMVQMVMGQL